MAKLTSHPLSLFCPQGFTCKSRINREYISGRGGLAALLVLGQPALPGARSAWQPVSLLCRKSCHHCHRPSPSRAPPPSLPTAWCRRARAPSSPVVGLLDVGIVRSCFNGVYCFAINISYHTFSFFPIVKRYPILKIALLSLQTLYISLKGT